MEHRYISRHVGGYLENHEVVKESLVLAAAGRHNVLITKENPSSDLARRLADTLGYILPPLTDEQATETARMYEQAKEETPVGHTVPVRVIPDYMSLAGMVGGGRPVRPGEVSLAHNGVLVVDNLQDFSSHALDHIASVTEQGAVRLIRVGEAHCFPADSLLVGTADPLPGGARSFDECSAAEIKFYRKHLGGRLMGQFEISCQLPKVKLSELFTPVDAEMEVIQGMRDQVMAAREFREWREEHGVDVMRGLSDATKRIHAANFDLLERYGHDLHMGQVCTVLSVARTSADIAGREKIAEEDVVKALALRAEGNDRTSEYMPREFREQAWSEERASYITMPSAARDEEVR